MGKELQRGGRSVEMEACESGSSRTERARFSRWQLRKYGFEEMLGVDD
jgi:hypothetical protein